jgi:hypothetical protein
VVAVTRGQVVLFMNSAMYPLTFLIRATQGTCARSESSRGLAPELILTWESSRRTFSPPAQLSAPGGVYNGKGISAR